ncbi:hypothetical protein BB559_003744 [Furculomyces boomerangus]|uniref:SAM domain-containing protein n=2 Tax=Harpellales TaxID=61421 RepID=A0A2T9YJ35_9FUNG|nr:hypothetical protein BB559_003744 [Furculomyces boomerangus]PWA02508.1 hypothetical protein BB558_001398 [Smittium angustum]
MLHNSAAQNYIKNNQKSRSYAGGTNSRDSGFHGPIQINSKERPMSAIFFANASHPLPEANEIDAWFESLTQYEDMLEDMAKVSLDPVFKDELNAIDQWFSVLSEPERTAALYNLIQHASDIQVRFFITILQQMAKMDPGLSSLKEADEDYPQNDSQDQLAHNSSQRNNSNSSQAHERVATTIQNSTHEFSTLEKSFPSFGIEDHNPVSVEQKKQIDAETHNSLFNNGWSPDATHQGDNYLFGSSSSMTRARESRYHNHQNPSLKPSNPSDTTASPRWNQGAIPSTGVAIGDAISKRNNGFPEHGSFSEADSNPDWRNKNGPTQGNMNKGVGLAGGVSTINTSLLNGISVSSIVGSSPKTPSFLLNETRRSFGEKDLNSYRWSTLSESLDPYMPMSQERSTSIPSILGSQPIGDRRSISNRLSMAFSSNRDSVASIVPPPGVYSTNHASPSLRSLQTSNIGAYPTSYGRQNQQKQHHLEDNFLQPAPAITNNQTLTNGFENTNTQSSNNFSSGSPTSTKSFGFKTNSHSYGSSSSRTGAYSTNNYSASRNPNEPTNSMNAAKVSSLIKQKYVIQNGYKNSLVSNQELKSGSGSTMSQAESHNEKATSANLQNMNTIPAQKITSNEKPIQQSTVQQTISKEADGINFELLEDIPSWMKSLRLHKYTACFGGMNYREIIELDDAQLSDLGVQALGARRKMLKVFEGIKNELNA